MSLTSVSVINETMARRYFPGQSPIGRRWGNSLTRNVLSLGLTLLLPLQRIDPLHDQLHGEREFRDADAERFWSTFRDRLPPIPGVETAAGTTPLPLRDSGDTDCYVDGHPRATDDYRMSATVSAVTAMRIPVRRGRTFAPTDCAREDRSVL